MIRLISNCNPEILQRFKKVLSEKMECRVVASPQRYPDSNFSIQHNSSAEMLEKLSEVMSPLDLPILRDDFLDNGDVVIVLPDVIDLARMFVGLLSDTEEMHSLIEQRICSFGVSRIISEGRVLVARNRFEVDSSTFEVQLLVWLLRTEGHDIAIDVFPEKKCCGDLFIADPAVAELSPKQKIFVHVFSDQEEIAEEICGLYRSKGFDAGSDHLEKEEFVAPFSTSSGWFDVDRDGDPAIRDEAIGILMSYLQEGGYDLESFPLYIGDDRSIDIWVYVASR